MCADPTRGLPTAGTCSGGCLPGHTHPPWRAVHGVLGRARVFAHPVRTEVPCRDPLACVCPADPAALDCALWDPWNFYQVLKVGESCPVRGQDEGPAARGSSLARCVEGRERRREALAFERLSLRTGTCKSTSQTSPGVTAAAKCVGFLVTHEKPKEGLPFTQARWQQPGRPTEPANPP